MSIRLKICPSCNVTITLLIAIVGIGNIAFAIHIHLIFLSMDAGYSMTVMEKRVCKNPQLNSKIYIEKKGGEKKKTNGHCIHINLN